MVVVHGACRYDGVVAVDALMDDGVLALLLVVVVPSWDGVAVVLMEEEAWEDAIDDDSIEWPQ